MEAGHNDPKYPKYEHFQLWGTCIHKCICIYIYKHIHLGMYLCIYVYTYIYIEMYMHFMFGCLDAADNSRQPSFCWEPGHGRPQFKTTSLPYELQSMLITSPSTKHPNPLVILGHQHIGSLIYGVFIIRVLGFLGEGIMNNRSFFGWTSEST